MAAEVRTPDGRTLAIETAGDPGGLPVIVQMGTPGSRLIYPPHAADAAARGIRLIAYDRPGYGGSTRHPQRSVADCAADVRAICGALGLDRVAMWGISGGGPHALACAALLGDVLVAVASLAALAPYGAEALDYFDGMGEENVQDIRLTHEDPAAARRKLEQERLEMLAASPGELAQAMSTLLSATDAAALEGPLAGYLDEVDRTGLRDGADGWWDDSLALVSPWGFDLQEIAVPVLLMHGRQDRFVPFAHGRWLAGRIPGADARLSHDDGHLTLLTRRVGEVHEWLLQHLEGPARGGRSAP